VTIDVDADGTPARGSSGRFSPDTAEASRQIFNQRPDAATNAASRGFAGLFDAIVSNIEQVIHGKTEAVELAIMCMLAEGHLLIEDVPGVGKTAWQRPCRRPSTAHGSACSSHPTFFRPIL
jgi:hypothetical protein